MSRNPSANSPSPYSTPWRSTNTSSEPGRCRRSATRPASAQTPASPAAIAPRRSRAAPARAVFPSRARADDADADDARVPTHDRARRRDHDERAWCRPPARRTSGPRPASGSRRVPGEGRDGQVHARTHTRLARSCSIVQLGGRHERPPRTRARRPRARHARRSRRRGAPPAAARCVRAGQPRADPGEIRHLRGHREVSIPTRRVPDVEGGRRRARRRPRKGGRSPRPSRSRGSRRAPNAATSTSARPREPNREEKRTNVFSGLCPERTSGKSVRALT